MDKYSKGLGVGLKICGVSKTNNHFHNPKKLSSMALPGKKSTYAYIYASVQCVLKWCSVGPLSLLQTTQENVSFIL